MHALLLESYDTKKKKKKKHFKKKSLKRMGLSPSIFLDQFIEKFPI